MMDEMGKVYADLLGHCRKMLTEVADERDAAQARIAELEAEIIKWKELTGLDEPSWDATLPDPTFATFATFPIILQGIGKSTANITFDELRATAVSDDD